MSGIPIEALRAVVDYCWNEEERDYEEQIRLNEMGHNDPRHIFTQLKIVNAWLVSEEMKEGVA